MSILLTSKDTKINYIFQDGEIDSLYLKVGYTSLPESRIMVVSIKTYLSREDSLIDRYIYTDVPDNNFHVHIDIYEEKNLEYATLYAIKRFESLGYKCEILDD